MLALYKISFEENFLQPDPSQASSRPANTGSVGNVFATFLKLGLTSFGGPIAHVSYFRQELVERRRWVDDNVYSQLLVLCQFLPGPASSQLGFSLGLLRAGWLGAVAAFLAFTLPSALLLIFFASLVSHLDSPIGVAAIHGLKLVALAVVAHSVMGMAKQLCPDTSHRTIAVAAASVLLVYGQAWVQLLVIGGSAIAGLICCRNVAKLPDQGLSLRYGPKLGGYLIVLFALMLGGLPLIAYSIDGLFAVIEAFYRAGALVFGGGHVVLPLLKESVVRPGWLSADEFLAGYGAAQAVPGPMFTLAAYLGARLPGEMGGIAGAAAALMAIFLPGFLLVAGMLPLWHALTRHPLATSAVAGVNAAVVGLLGAALYNPIWISAIRGPSDVAIALTGFALLSIWRVSALFVVFWCVAANVTILLFGCWMAN